MLELFLHFEFKSILLQRVVGIDVVDPFIVLELEQFAFLFVKLFQFIDLFGVQISRAFDLLFIIFFERIFAFFELDFMFINEPFDGLLLFDIPF